MKFNSTTGKIYEDDPNVRIPQKDLVSQIQKEDIADEWSGPSHRGPSYDHSARTLQQEQELGKKMWLAKQKEENKSPLPVAMGNNYKSDLRSSNQKKRDAWAEKKRDAYDEKKFGIKQRLKNVRGPSTAELIYKGMSPQEKGSHNAEQRRKNLDNPFDPGAVVSKPFPADAFTLSTDHGPNQNLNAPIPKEVNQIMNKEIENIRQMRMDAERLRGIPKRRLEIKKKELAGLHEDFTREKLQIAAILREEDDKV